MHLATHLVTNSTLAAGFNPFDGVSPTFGPFTPLLKNKMGMFLGLTWAICFCVAAYYLTVSITRLGTARKGGYGDSLDDAKNDLLKAAVATIGLASVPVIFAVLIAN